MKKAPLLLFATLTSFCLGFAVKGFLIKPVAETGRVTGIAGIFFKCKDPRTLKAWYKKHLGLNTGPYGASFIWQEGADSTKKGTMQWTPFNDSTKYFAPSTKDFMINYRVVDITALTAQLKKEDVTVLDTIETYDYGKFVHIMDIEGNKIELYQPNYAYKSK